MPDSTPPPVPTAQHHANLASFLNIMEKLGIVALTLAPVVVAPFVKTTQGQVILQAETPVAQALAQALNTALQTG